MTIPVRESASLQSLTSRYTQFRTSLEDFWAREESAPIAEKCVEISGFPVRLQTNHPALIEALDLALPLYTVAPNQDASPLEMRIVVRSMPRDPGPPERLVNAIQYSSHESWFAIHYAQWGFCSVDYDARTVHAVLAPSFAEQPQLICQVLMNTVLTNYLTRRGYALLHATGIGREGRAVLLMAPHNTGKSTTALRLLFSGYQLISDSHIYAKEHAGGLMLTGFPIGRIKLRRDMLHHFPQVAHLVAPEVVRHETKYVVDLRGIAPSRVVTETVFPQAIDLCVLQRHSGTDTRLEEVGREEMEEAVIRNSLHLDPEPVWLENLRVLDRLLNQARCFRLAIGEDPERMIAAIDSLWKG
jgi:hypothetical protein